MYGCKWRTGSRKPNLLVVISIIRIFVITLVVVTLYVSARFALDPQETSKLKVDSQKRDLSSELVGVITNYNRETQKFPWEGNTFGWTQSSQINLEELKNKEFRDEIFIGKGMGEGVWACFAPISKHERVDIIKLRSLTPGAELPEGGLPEYCENNPDWQSSFCYVCVSK